MVTTLVWPPVAWGKTGRVEVIVFLPQKYSFIFSVYIELHGRPSIPKFLPSTRELHLAWSTNSHYKISMYMLLYRMVREAAMNILIGKRKQVTYFNN